MASYVQVANLAAIKIGTQARITAPNDDTTIARAVASVWDVERRATIREGSYNFATKRERLPALAETPVLRTFAYQMPADSLRLLQVADIGSDYELEAGKILCDASAPLAIRYLRDVPELAEWDDLTAEAFGCRIAWRIGKRIAGSNFSQDNAWEEYQAAIAAAKRVDAQENPRIEQEDGSWIEARLAYGASGMLPAGTWNSGALGPDGW